MMKKRVTFIKFMTLLVVFTGCSRFHSSHEGSPMQTLVDLTQPIGENIPYFPGGISPYFELLRSIEAHGYNLFKLTFSDHTGTHVDFPFHFLKNGKKSSDFSLDEMCFPAVLIDISEKCESDPDYALTITDVEKYENVHGKISSSHFVLVRTGWGKYWKFPARYSGRDENGILHFPGVSREAAELIIKGRKARGIGIDTLSIDPGISKTFEAHRVVLGYGRFAVENLNLPPDLPVRIKRMCVWPLKLEGTGGAPARVGAWVR